VTDCRYNGITKAFKRTLTINCTTRSYVWVPQNYDGRNMFIAATTLTPTREALLLNYLSHIPNSKSQFPFQIKDWIKKEFQYLIMSQKRCVASLLLTLNSENKSTIGKAFNCLCIFYLQALKLSSLRLHFSTIILLYRLQLRHEFNTNQSEVIFRRYNTHCIQLTRRC
jgi:hypothetical protein